MHLSTSNVKRDRIYLRVLPVDSLRTANCGVSHQAFACAYPSSVVTVIPTSGDGVPHSDSNMSTILFSAPYNATNQCTFPSTPVLRHERFNCHITIMGNTIRWPAKVGLVGWAPQRTTNPPTLSFRSVLLLFYCAGRFIHHPNDLLRHTLCCLFYALA